MPTRLPDHTTARRQPVDVTRRSFLRFLAPLTLAGFTALADTDVVARWLRCSFTGPSPRPA